MLPLLFQFIPQTKCEPIFFELIEPFVEAVPQVFVLVCIAALSGRIDTYSGKASECIDQNCGVVGLLAGDYRLFAPEADPRFFASFILSVVSASFGMCRFLKSGPMTLVPRQSFIYD